MTLPRTDAFADIATGLPPDGRGWVHGDHRTIDKADDNWGLVHRFAKLDTGLIETNPAVPVFAWLAWRTVAQAADISVRSLAFWRREAGTPLDVRLGLMARLGAISGTQTASGVPRWFQADAYTMEIAVSAGAQTATLELVKVSQGLRAVLVSAAIAEFLPSKLYQLELIVTDEGANVRLRGLIDGVETANVADTVSPITGAGFYGFLGNTEISGADKTRTGIRNFEARSSDGATLWHKDDFDRANKAGADSTLTGLWHSGKITAIAGGQINNNGLLDTDLVDLYQVRPFRADYSVSLDIKFPNTTDADWWGIIVRGTKGDTAGGLGNLTGYVVAATASSTTDNVEIRKYVGGVLIETVTRSFTFLAATAYTLEAVIAGDVKVSVTAKIDSAAQGAAYTDSSASRIRSAGLTGIYSLRVTGSPSMTADNWVLADGTDPSVAPTVILPGNESSGITEYPYAFGEVPVGARDGRRIYGLPFTPASESEVAVMVEGVLWRRRSFPSSLAPAEYEVDVASGKIRFERGLPETWDVRIEGNRTGQSPVTFETPAGVINGVNKVFTTTATAPSDANRARVYVDGLRVLYTAGSPATGEFSWSGTTLTTGDAPWSFIDLMFPVASPELRWGISPTVISGTGNVGFELGFRPNSLGQLYPSVSGARLIPAAGIFGPDRFGGLGTEISLGSALLASQTLVVDAFEQGAYLETLNVVPSDPSTEILAYRPVGHVMIDRYVQSFAGDTGNIRRWPLEWRSLPGVLYRELVDFFDRHNGPEHEFQWTPPGEFTPGMFALESFDDGQMVAVGQYLGQTTTIHNVRATLRELLNT